MQIDVEQLLDRSGMGPVHRRALVLCALVALFDGYDLQSMASAIPTLAGDWGMAPGDLRWIGTAALVGIAGAALFVSPLGDHLGRRTLLLASFALIGIATVMTATATDVNALFAWRVITGIGLGASMPNALALAAEYVPLNRRIALITLLSAGFSLGGASSGFLAPALIALGGWRAIFAAGGAAMLLLWLPLLALPESVRFMVVRGRAPHAIGAQLERLAPAYRFSAEHRFSLPANLARRVSVRELFRDGLAPTTVTLWAIFFLNLGLLFLLATWLPVLLRAHGLPLDSALRYAALFQIGGVARWVSSFLAGARLGSFRRAGRFLCHRRPARCCCSPRGLPRQYHSLCCCSSSATAWSACRPFSMRSPRAFIRREHAQREWDGRTASVAAAPFSHRSSAARFSARTRVRRACSCLRSR